MTRLFITAAKRSAITAAVVMLLASPFAPLVAQAQTGDTGAQSQAAAPAAPSPTPGAPTNQQNQNIGVDNNSSIGCNFTTAFSSGFGSTFALCLTNVVYVFTVGIGSGFAYVSAYFFDWAVALSLNGGSYALDFVSTGWTTARDIANMAFLFILLYIAFKIIFEAETNDTIHMLTMVIVVALLVNFSFFFTRLAIDAGNILSIQFYNAINAPSIATTAAGQTSGALSNAANASTLFANSNSKDLTAGIMGMLQLQNLFNTSSFQAFFQPNGQSSGPGFLVTTIALTFLYIAAAIMFWILTVAFITNGTKFLFRIVILWFLIIASPLAFVAFAVPKFKGYYQQWQDALISHAFYPAAFMFIFLILTNFAAQMSCGANGAAVQGCAGLINGIFNGLQSANNSSSAVAAIGYAAANVGIRLGFVIAMLYIGMEAAKKIGMFGAEAANHAGNWVGGRMTTVFRKTGGAVGAGAPAWALRNTVGWAGDKFSKSNIGRDLAARGGLLGRTAWRGAGALGRQSYDARGGLASLGVKENIIGKAGGEGGYTTKFDARVKMREEEAKKLKPSESKLAQAQAKVVKGLSQADKQELADLANKYVDQKEAFEGGAATREEVRTAKKAFDAKVKTLGIIDKSREIAGYKNDKTYAGSIETKSFRNLWGAGQGTPGWIWAADKEAAATIRGAKTDAERIKNVLGKLGVTPTPAPPPAPPPSTLSPTLPIPPTPTGPTGTTGTTS